MPENLRIFISSPSDVKPERLIAERVIDRLSREFSFHFHIEPVLWEREPLIATEHFQTMITPPSQTDMVVVILWSRLGTFLPDDEFRGAITGRPVTGTEWEFEDAVKAYRDRSRPPLLLYRKSAPIFVSLDDDDQLENQRYQRLSVQDFIARWVEDPETGLSKVASHQFDDPANFEDMLETHLRELIRSRMEGAGQGPTTARWCEGSPFRGLQSFDLEHAAIFFGRTKARNELRETLMRQEAKGCAFTIVLGASGSGKSSLVKAGLLADITIPGMVEGVGLFRYGQMRPSDHDGCVFATLASALLSDSALPELKDLQYSPDRLARLLQNTPGEVDLPIRQGLSKAGEAAKLTGHATARLVLIVDQLEELFTQSATTDTERAMFIKALEALARSGQVWVVATLRSDFFEHIERMPDLSALARGDGTYSLEPTNDFELGQIIRMPAREAGLRYEHNSETGSSLDETLLIAAGHSPGAMPLLEFMLDQLWQSRTEQGVLTYEAYDRLGGLEGALGERAEQIFQSKDQNVQDAFGRVIRALVTVTSDESQAFASRAVALSNFDPGAPGRVLIDALLAPDSRLLVMDGDDGHRATVRLAHEALLTHWPRAQRQIAQDRKDIEVRSRIEQAYKWWRDERDRGRLLRDLALSEAQDLLKRAGDELGEDIVSFVEASTEYEQEKRDRRLRNIRYAAAGIGAFGVVAFIGAIFGFIGQRNAEEQRAEVLRTQSLLLADLAQQSVAEGDAVTAMLLSLEALPDETAPNGTSAKERPHVMQSTDGLYTSAHRQQEVAVLGGHQGELQSAVFSPDGTRILKVAEDDSVRLWDGQTGAEINVLDGHEGWVSNAVFSPNGMRIATLSQDGNVHLWDGHTGAEIDALEDHQDWVDHAVFSPDSSRIVTTSYDGPVRLWNGHTGEEIAMLEGHNDEVNIVVFSPDGTRIIMPSDDYTLGLWDGRTGAEIAVLEGHIRAAKGAVFSPDSKRIVAVSDEDSARLWNGVTGAEIAVLESHQGWVDNAVFSPDSTRIVTTSRGNIAHIWDGQTGAEIDALEGHNGSVIATVFSPDSQRLVTTSYAGLARLWNGQTGAEIDALEGHNVGVRIAVFSPDSQRMVTTSFGEAAHLWDGQTGEEIGMLVGHEGWVNSADFSPDGTRIVTASQDGTARLWDAQTGSEIDVFRGHQGWVYNAVFSPDGGRILSFSQDGTARLWDGQTPVLVRHKRLLSNAVFSPDGARMVTVANEDIARLWHGQTGEEIAVVEGHEGWVNNAVFSPDGTRLVTLSDGGSARLWNGQTGDEIALSKIHIGTVRSAVFSPDGTRMVTTSNDNIARLWDGQTGEEIDMLVGHQAWVSSAVFSPDGTRIVTVANEDTARLWNGQTGAKIAVLEGHDGRVWSAAFSPDSQRIVTTSSDERAPRLWNGQTGEEITALEGHEGRVSSAVFSPDSTRIFTVSLDDPVRLWDAETGSEFVELEGHHDLVDSAVFSPDSTRIVTVSDEGAARLWNGYTGKEIAVLEGNKSKVYRAIFSPDGTRVVTAYDDGTARLWEGHTGEEIAVFEGRPGWDRAVFSPDGRWVVTVSDSGTARLWEGQTGAPLAGLFAHESRVLWAVFSPDGNRLLTASDDGTARLWRIFPTTQALVDEAKESVPRCLTREQRQQFYLSPEVPEWCYAMNKWPYRQSDTPTDE